MFLDFPNGCGFIVELPAPQCFAPNHSFRLLLMLEFHFLYINIQHVEYKVYQTRIYRYAIHEGHYGKQDKMLLKLANTSPCAAAVASNLL